ncbi:MAG: hypothetical protein WBG46_11455 [Nonlabens sp.]
MKKILILLICLVAVSFSKENFEVDEISKINATSADEELILNSNQNETDSFSVPAMWVESVITNVDSDGCFHLNNILWSVGLVGGESNFIITHVWESVVCGMDVSDPMEGIKTHADLTNIKFTQINCNSGYLSVDYMVSLGSETEGGPCLADFLTKADVQLSYIKQRNKLIYN